LSILKLQNILDKVADISGIDYLKKNYLELRNFELELKFPAKILNP